MNLFKNFKSGVDKNSGYDEDYYGKTDVAEEEEPDVRPSATVSAEAPEYDRPAPVQTQHRMNTVKADASSYSMKIMKPTVYDDGPVIAQELLANNAVIINLENASAEVAANLIFFLDGVTYAINGQLKAVSANTFMLTPHSMNVSEAQIEQEPEAAPEQNYTYPNTGYGAGYRG